MSAWFLDSELSTCFLLYMVTLVTTLTKATTTATITLSIQSNFLG